jgi:hypothetical protein
LRKIRGGKKNKNISKREAERVGRALGFGRSKGKTGFFEEAYVALTDETLSKAVQSRIAAGEKAYRAYEIVAKEYGFDSSTVRRAFVRFTEPK